MGALFLAVLITLVGASGGSFLALRSTRHLIDQRRQRIGRWTAVLLAGAGGAQIASQFYDLGHQLQLNADIEDFDSGLRQRFDALAFATAVRGILFYGSLLVGLAVLVALIATRGRRRLRAAAPTA